MIGADDFEPRVGTYTYPTDPRYHHNAADLVEFRVKPLTDATAFRVTLNTLDDPSRVAFTIALGDSRAPVAYPHGAQVSGPARLFLTVHGTTADLVDAATGKPAGPPPSVKVDRLRHQFQVTVPHASWNPGGSVVRMAIGVGLWDTANQRYLVPGQVATATAPGGAGVLSDPPAFFNVGFRTHEPAGALIPDMPVTPNWWRDRTEATALANGDITPLAAYVDFGKLRAGLTDDSGVPKTGTVTRIFSSRFSVGQGVDYSRSDVQYLGRLQPYLVYVPHQEASKPYGLLLDLHGYTANYQLVAGTKQIEQLAERGTGTILVSPEARSPMGSYSTGLQAADAFEALADVARHYRVDWSWTDITGYSAGGGGAWLFATHFPDLFGRAFIQALSAPAGAPLASLRNLPLWLWTAYGSE